MYRNRLRGGHKVGAPRSLAQPTQHHSGPVHPGGSFGRQYGDPLQPHQPPPSHTQPPPQPHQGAGNTNNNNNNWGWGGDGTDGAWNWGEDTCWSGSNNNQQLQQQQQHLGQQKQHYQPAHSQPHAFSQHMPSHSSHQHFSKPAENVPSYTSVVTANPSHFQHVTPSTQHHQPEQQEYINGGSQNGQGAWDWAADNWGTDWSSTDTYNNNKNTTVSTKPVDYLSSDSQQQQSYHSPSQPHQQQTQYQNYQQPQLPQFHHNQETADQSFGINPEKTHHDSSQSEQHHGRIQHEPKQKHRDPQPQQYAAPSHTSAAMGSEDDWSWGNDDWQVNGQVSEQVQLPATQGSSAAQSSVPLRDTKGTPVTHMTGSTEPVCDGWLNVATEAHMDSKPSSEMTQVSQCEERQVYEHQQHHYQEQQHSFQQQQQHYQELQHNHHHHQQQQQHCHEQQENLQQQYQEQQGTYESHEHYQYQEHSHLYHEHQHQSQHQDQQQQPQHKQEEKQPESELHYQDQQTAEQQQPFQEKASNDQEHLDQFHYQAEQPKHLEKQQYQTQEQAHWEEEHAQELHHQELQYTQNMEQQKPSHEQHHHYTDQQWDNNWGQSDFSTTAPEGGTGIHKDTTTGITEHSCLETSSYTSKAEHTVNETWDKAKTVDHALHEERQQPTSEQLEKLSMQPQAEDACAVATSAVTPDTTTAQHNTVSTQSSSVMVDNFSDGWGDGWGESEAPLETTEPHEKIQTTETAETNRETLSETDREHASDRDIAATYLSTSDEISVQTPASAAVKEVPVDHNVNNYIGNEQCSAEAWEDEWDQDVAGEEHHFTNHHADTQASHALEALADKIGGVNLGHNTDECRVENILPSGDLVPQSSNYLNPESVQSGQKDEEFSSQDDTSHVTEVEIYSGYPPQDSIEDRAYDADQPADFQSQPEMSQDYQKPQTDHFSHPSPVPSPREPHLFPSSQPQEPSQHPTSPPQNSHAFPASPSQDSLYNQGTTIVPPVPDPIVSRIPDGASSIPEVMIAATVATGAPEAGSSSSVDTQRSGVTGHSRELPQPHVSSQSTITSHSPVSSHPLCPPHYPVHPPSSHTLPDRPSSNQSAHSVHSTQSTHSAHSTHSTHSSHSPHLSYFPFYGHSTLIQNQEVPIQEEGEMQVLSARDQEPTQATVPATGDATVDPTAPPSNCPVGPPPVVGPHGAVPSLRARKGSPFQPPQGTQSSPGPTSTPPLQPQFIVPSQNDNISAPPAVSTYQDIGANLEAPPDNAEGVEQQAGMSLWNSNQAVPLNVKLAVAAPPSDYLAPVQPPVSSHAIPVVVPGMVKEEKASPSIQPSNPDLMDPPAAHIANLQATVAKPKVQSLAAMATSSSPAVLDLSKPPRAPAEPVGDVFQDYPETPNFRRMVPGESSKGTSGPVAAYQGPAPVPAMPSERVVTGNDNPQPVPLVRVKQEPGEVRSPPDGPATSDLSGAGAAVVPPIRSATIGSEEPKSRSFASGNSGSRSDLTGEQRVGKWERDHSRDRTGDGYRDRSRDRGGGGRDYYRDDSPHSRRSYDRDDRRRRWRESDDSDISDTDRRYYESSRERRDRAYHDELDRYSDRPPKDDKDRARDKRRDYRDRSKDYYRSYDDDPYYGRGDRSEPVSRSSSINNLDSEGERSAGHSHHHRSHRDYYDRASRDRDRDRDSSYSRDYYQRGSTGGVGSSGGWDPRDPRRDPRYYGQRGGYENPYNNAMYDQYQLYYQYYRNHPYYKEYYQQWMKQYGQAYGHQPSDSSFYDDRISIHSGRSSVNDELKKSVSSQFMQDFHGGQGYEPPSSIYPDTSFSHLKSYPSGEISGVASVADDTGSELAPQQVHRMTPVLFGRPHITARFTPGGQLVLVPPRDPREGEGAVVQLRDTQKMLQLDPVQARTVHQMKSYPGPLTMSETHKDVVVRFCEQRASEAVHTPSLPDRESVALLWEYLALLVKQNGKLYGSDIAGLLLKGREEGTGRSSGRSSARNSGRTSPQDGQDDLPTDTPSDGGIRDDQPEHRAPPAPLQPPARDESVLLGKFTDMLCLGRKREAVDYAMKEGLWGHALALAYKMDTTTHTRALAAFSASIPRTDVLHTLFQQLSGKKPEITKSYTYDQWGDWQRHLAVMVSNPTGQPQRDRASVVALGDTLVRRDQLHAAHFCYLVADVVPGTYSEKDSKLVLVGSSHTHSFLAFATNEAIQCTEVYEYARALDSGNSPILPSFQAYKFIYALRLTECGFPAEALRYCEVIAQAVIRDSGQHRSAFVSQVLDLATRLKYHDLHYQMGEGEVADMPDPQWLLDLHTALDHTKAQDASQELVASEGITQNMQDSSHAQDSTQHVPSSSTSQYPSYTDSSYPHDYNSSAADIYSQGPESFQNQDSYHHQDSYHNQEVYHTQNQKQSYPPQDVLDGLGQQGYDTPLNSAESSLPNATHQKEGEQHGPGSIPLMQPSTSASTEYGYDGSYWTPNARYQQRPPEAASPYLSSPAQVDAPQPCSIPPSPEMSGDQPPSHPQQPSYSSWDQPTPPQPPAPETTCDSPSHQGDQQPQSAPQRTPEEEAYWAEMTGKKSSNTSSDALKPESVKKQEEEKKKPEKDGDKSGEKGGWISSIFGWKKSKQAVLPDDKNPSIVWDDQKKKWVNVDGEEEVSTSLPPPPRSGLTAPPQAPIARGGPRKNRYVNTETDTSRSNMPAMNPILPPMPGSTPPMPAPPSSVSPQPIMLPQPLPPNQQDQSPVHQPQNHPQPQLSQEAPQGTLSEEAGGGGEQNPVPMMGAPPPAGATSAPQFFNPMQFSKTGGPGLGPGLGPAGPHSRRGRRGGGYPGKR